MAAAAAAAAAVWHTLLNTHIHQGLRDIYYHGIIATATTYIHQLADASVCVAAILNLRNHSAELCVIFHILNFLNFIVTQVDSDFYDSKEQPV